MRFYRQNKLDQLIFYCQMEQAVPLLTPGRIEDLNSMVVGISGENSKSLQELLGEQVELGSATMMKLYNLVVEEWGKKQKIIDNLCHFSMTMMITVEFLWSQKQDHEDKISSAEVVIDGLHQHIQHLGDENEVFQSKISEAEFQIDMIAGEKTKMEELYRTQSCCNFAESNHPKDRTPEEEAELHANSLDLHESSLLLEEKSQLLLAQRQNEISVLKGEKQILEKRIKEIAGENEMFKIEVELAEIAIKDAFSYREASLLSGSRSSDLDVGGRDDFGATKSHGDLQNGELDCFSNLGESFHFQHKNNLLNQIIQSERRPQLSLRESSYFNESYDSSLALIKQSSEDVTATDNPFKKKLSKISEPSEIFDLKASVLSCRQEPMKRTILESRLIKDKKTVSLQCNLIKGLPRLSFQYKDNVYEEVNMLKLRPTKTDKTGKTQKQHKGPNHKKTQKGSLALSKSDILRPNIDEECRKGHKAAVDSGQKKQGGTGNSLSKLYSFLTSRIISRRIKVK